MCLCVLEGCGVNGLDFPNGAAIPTDDHCQECTCVVRLSEIVVLYENKSTDFLFQRLFGVLYLSEWKFGMFNTSMSCLVLSQPCALCWRMLPSVKRLPNLIHIA